MTNTTTESYTADLLNKTIAQAKRDFVNHSITRVRFGVWRCAAPGTLINHFFVSYSPGAVMCHGDIGELLFVPISKPHALRWAKGVFRSDYIEYPFQKLSRQIKSKEYRSEVARENVAYLVSEEEDPKRKAEMVEAAEWLDCDDEQNYFEFIHDWVDEPEGLYAHTWTFRALYVYQALCWFMQQANADDARFAEELA